MPTEPDSLPPPNANATADQIAEIEDAYAPVRPKPGA